MKMVYTVETDRSRIYPWGLLPEEMGMMCPLSLRSKTADCFYLKKEKNVLLPEYLFRQKDGWAMCIL